MQNPHHRHGASSIDAVHQHLKALRWRDEALAKDRRGAVNTDHLPPLSLVACVWLASVVITVVVAVPRNMSILLVVHFPLVTLNTIVQLVIRGFVMMKPTRLRVARGVLNAVCTVLSMIALLGCITPTIKAYMDIGFYYNAEDATNTTLYSTDRHGAVYATYYYSQRAANGSVADTNGTTLPIVPFADHQHPASDHSVFSLWTVVCVMTPTLAYACLNLLLCFAFRTRDTLPATYRSPSLY